MLGTVDMLAGVVALVRVDRRIGARAVDMADAVARAEHEGPVPDHEPVAIEGADGRAGDTVALGVVRASVAWALEARDARAWPDRHGAGVGLDLLRIAGKPLRLCRAADVGAAVGDDREARDAVLLAGVSDESRPPADVLRLVLLRVELRDDVLPLRKVVERSKIDVLVALVDEGGLDHEAERGERDERADRRADPEGRELEEDATRVALGLLGPFLFLDRQLGDRLDDRLPLGSRPRP